LSNSAGYGAFTTRFAQQVYRLTSITTNAEAGWYLNLDDETVYRIDRGILDQLAELNDRVYRAMLLKEQFLEVYRADSRKAAQTGLRQWVHEAFASQIPAFIELALKFFRKRHYILNYFRMRITAAISEGINNKIKRLERMAYGYKDVAYFLLKIHQHCGLLNLFEKFEQLSCISIY
jgi:hypothetical protein